MYFIYIWSDYSTLHGYWTGRHKKTNEIPCTGFVDLLDEKVNIPILIEDIKHKSVKIYKSKDNAIKMAKRLPEQLKESIPSQLVIKFYESGYWNRWNINVYNENGECIYKVISGEGLIADK